MFAYYCTLQDELVRMEDRFYILGFPWKHGRTPRNEGMDNALKTFKYSVLLMCSKRVPAGMDNALKTLKYNVLLMCS